MRRFEGSRLVVASHNKGKVEEIADLLANHPISIVSAADLGLAEPAETEDSFVGNARIKAHAAASATGLPALADDSGLCVDALHGMPGVWTADWAETPTGRDFSIAMARVCTLLDEKGPGATRSARFVCTLVLAWPDGDDAVFEGSVNGHIVCPGRGLRGHGYDPIFVPDGHSQTFGEMDRWQKNRMSHRARAFAQLLPRFT
jgi:XTP/dITP diphosphohydrolase